MDDSYLSISFKVYPISGIEILIAELSLLEFELFEEKPYGLIAYIKSSEYSQNIFEKVKILNSKEFEVEFEVKKVENKNWNEEWEKIASSVYLIFGDWKLPAFALKARKEYAEVRKV